MTVWRAVALGIGSMVGAGIFALLGEVGAVAGASVWVAFLAGGVVALLNGYSYGRLGARYPSAGGPVDYLARGYGVGVFSGGLSIFYYAAGVIGMAMVARAFGSYAATLLGWAQPSSWQIWQGICGSGDGDDRMEPPGRRPRRPGRRALTA